jgi:hypothetical protein
MSHVALGLAGMAVGGGGGGPGGAGMQGGGIQVMGGMQGPPPPRPPPGPPPQGMGMQQGVHGELRGCVWGGGGGGWALRAWRGFAGLPSARATTCCSSCC